MEVFSFFFIFASHTDYPIDIKGLSATVLLLGNGDILGCSGIVSSIFVKSKETLGYSKGKWKVLFITAFLIASRAISQWGDSKETLMAEQKMMAESKSLPIVSTLGFCVAGFLVGFGTRLGNGCTSGHGICGLGKMGNLSGFIISLIQVSKLIIKLRLMLLFYSTF